MKKLLASLAIAATVITPIAASAATWYKADITLPRTGQWNTTDRTAVSNTQGTYVSNNKYDVYSWIENRMNGTRVGPTQYWEGGRSTGAQFHKTNMYGKDIHASFKTSAVNYFTTTAHVEWAP